MLPTREGSFRFFRCFGIDVHVHWTWFMLVLYVVSTRRAEYSQPVWVLAEYLSLFAIVLLHEFGHALACRQTGGRADLIVLWPLGGVAYVAPPERAGAQLWSIAAGPLVNVALVPVLFGALKLAEAQGWLAQNADLADWLLTVNYINAVLLVFNMLPIYPLDGGQIFRSVLWFGIGPVRSLLIATTVGLVGGLGLVAYGLYLGRMWTVVMAGFLLFNCWKSFQYARRWAEVQRAARVNPDKGQ